MSAQQQTTEETRTDAFGTLEKLGLKLTKSSQYDYSAIQGKKCYGQLLNNPDFVGWEQFEKRAAKADVAKMVVPQMEGIDFGNNRFVVRNGQFVASVSDSYNLIQDREVLMNLREAGKQMSLTPVGHLRFDGGRMTGDMVWVGAETQVEILKDTGEDIAVGAQFFNSIDASRSIGFSAMSIRTICCNLNLWGRDLAGFRATHADSTAVEQMEKAIAALLEQYKKLPAVINAAKADTVRVEEVPLLLHGVRFPIAYVSTKKGLHLGNLEQLRMYEPSIPEGAKQVSRWQVYQAATACLTHGARLNPVGNEYFNKLASGLLTKNIDTLLSSGKERRDSFESRRQAILAARPKKEPKAPKAAKAPKTPSVGGTVKSVAVKPAAPKKDLKALAQELKAKRISKAKGSS